MGIGDQPMTAVPSGPPRPTTFPRVPHAELFSLITSVVQCQQFQVNRQEAEFGLHALIFHRTKAVTVCNLQRE